METDVRKRRAVAYWLLLGVFMIVVQTFLGGVTRLTDSGLSMTQWNPIMGVIPPHTQQQWNDAFNGYKQIGQYKYMNSDFTLQNFKSIFYWEWFHRLWARTLGVVFFIGFLFFLIKGYFDKKMVMPLVILFLLGALQGVVGWIMVSSGLNDTHLYVDHIKLAIHFISAMILACYTLWFALQLLIKPGERVPNSPLHNLTAYIIALLGIQLMYGGFMAGLHAGIAAPTWPTINGIWVPGASLTHHSWVNNVINVQFIHRTMAYALLVLIGVWFYRTRKYVNISQYSLFKKTSLWPLILVCTQVLLGIFTVLSASTIQFRHFGQYQVLAEIHQLVAMFLLISLIVNLYVIKSEKTATA